MITGPAQPTAVVVQTPPPRTTARASRVQAYDGLRALALAVVFAHHVDVEALPGGFLGVDLFFVLSGHLITGLLLREHRLTGRIWLRGFFGRRVLRLAPALLVALPPTLLLALALDIGRPGPDALAALLYLTDVYAPLTHTTGGAFGHTWSLAVEEQFYLVWPFLLLGCLALARRRTRSSREVLVGVLVAIGVLSTALSAVLASTVPTTDLYRSPVPHLAALAVGSLLAVLLAPDGARPASLRAPRWLTSAVLPSLVLALLVGCLPFLAHDATWPYTGGLLGVSLALALVVGHVASRPDSPLATVLSLRPVVWLGVRSYSGYLWHYPVLYALIRTVETPWLVASLGIVVSLLATELSYRFVEQPFLRRKHLFDPPAAPGTPPA